MPFRFALALLSVACVTLAVPAQAAPPPIQPLPTLNLPSYLGTWYQVAWFPNRFQKQCISDTVAIYRRLPAGIEVVNRCRVADGGTDSITGLARPADAVIRSDTLAPARLEGSFLPVWLRWVPAWGDYWVIRLADDGRYAVVSEGTKQYLWVLSRTPVLSAADETEIRSFLADQGFGLARWQAHPHTR